MPDGKPNRKPGGKLYLWSIVRRLQPRAPIDNTQHDDKLSRRAFGSPDRRRNGGLVSDKKHWMIYGANGYTGRLIAEEAKRQDLAPILAGRNLRAIEALARELALPCRVFDLADSSAARAALADVAVVANCAGPFSATSERMIDACLATRTHYADITGEIAVFVDAQLRHDVARAAGIVICPGVGFDVIPTDCVAACLKEALPDATQLALGFAGAGAISPGTARTSIEGLKLGGRVRTAGHIVQVPLAYRARMIDFGTGDRLAVTFPWGDIATAYFSTGIPNIEVYIASSPAALLRLRRLNRIRKLLALAPIEAVAKRIAGRVNTGPSPERFASGTTYVWGEGAQQRRLDPHGAAYHQQRLSVDRGWRPAGRCDLARERARRRLLHALAVAGSALRRESAGVERDRDRLVVTGCRAAAGRNRR